MATYFVTGVSKGLGKAICMLLLEKKNRVVGIGRKSDIVHENFTFIECDLRNLEQVSNISFKSNDDKLVLINNAGVIGNIQRLSDQSSSDCSEVMTVNVITPMILTSNFLRDTEIVGQRIVVNISSGAASRSIPGWASYCASKAALDRFSETVQLEENEKGSNAKVLSIAPGVVDTDMQVKIRSAQQNDFSSLQKFIDLKKNEELLSPKRAAMNILEKIIEMEMN